MTSGMSSGSGTPSPASAPDTVSPGVPSWGDLLTRDRWIDSGRIVVSGVIALL